MRELLGQFRVFVPDDLPAEERTLEPREALAVRWAETLATDWRKIDGAFMDEARSIFSDEEVVELGMMIGQYLAFGRLLVQLDMHKSACEIYPTGE